MHNEEFLAVDYPPVAPIAPEVPGAEHAVETAAHESAGPHISIKPETLDHLYGLPITNSYLTSLIVIIVFIGIALYYREQSESKQKGNFYYLMQAFLRGMHGFFSTLVGTKADYLFPLLASLFIYILLQNWFGLLPGVGSVTIRVVEDGVEHWYPLLRGATADLNTTLAMALVAFAAVQYMGVKFLGFKTYISKFINFSNPINFVIGLFELISEFSRIISFSFRLFGNIFAGEVMLVIIASLVPLFVPFPFLVMETFVGFLQAVVFSMLTAVFISLAISHH